MEFKNAKEDIQFILSFFSETFSRPSIKVFSSFVISFIQAGKEWWCYRCERASHVAIFVDRKDVLMVTKNAVSPKSSKLVT